MTRGTAGAALRENASGGHWFHAGTSETLMPVLGTRVSGGSTREPLDTRFQTGTACEPVPPMLGDADLRVRNRFSQCWEQRSVVARIPHRAQDRFCRETSLRQ